MQAKDDMVIDMQVELLKVLASHVRLKILYLLEADKPMPVSELRRILDVSKANLSQHLSVMKKSGIVTTEQKGRNTEVILTFDALKQACAFVSQVITDRSLVQAKDLIRSMRKKPAKKKRKNHESA